MVHIHGGGFVAQTSKSHEPYLKSWAQELGAPILSIDYSLAPEAPFPRALEECFYAYCWAVKHCALLGEPPSQPASARTRHNKGKEPRGAGASVLTPCLPVHLPAPSLCHLPIVSPAPSSSASSVAPGLPPSTQPFPLPASPDSSPDAPSHTAP